jgi:two-component system sensor histidine kinase BaeS
MRIGLTGKLLLVLGLTSTLSVAGMGLAALWSFQHGFLDYLGRQELKRIRPIGDALLQTYREQGSWDFVVRNPRAWPRLVDDAMAPEGGNAARRSQALPESRSGEQAPSRNPRNSQLLNRLRLLDEARNQIAGRVVGETRDEVLSPLIADGAVVGWLGLSSPVWLEDELAQRFHRQHNRTLLWMSLTALALALLLGGTLGTAMLRRIHAVAAGARQLAEGDYRARVALEGRDELTELAQDFNQLALALERSEALRRRAMADVSHELRTPLAVARAELDALIDGIRPCTKERLEQLHGRLLTLGRLLDDLYDLALSDSGALNYRFAGLDLAEILRAAVADRESSCADKQIALRIQIEDGLRMDGDAERLRQVLDNLLANSLRYTDAGGFIRIIAARTSMRSASR